MRRLLLVLIGGLALLLVLAVAAFVSQRNYKPTGQVVALVNRQEITLQDLQAEARAKAVDLNDSTTPALLSTVIDRTFLAQEAHARRLDELPTYPSDRTRLNQRLLATQLTTQLQTSIADVSDAEALAYVNNHPLSYAKRMTLRLTQIRFKADATVLQRLASRPTLSSLRIALHDAGLSAAERTGSASSDSMAPELAMALLKLPADGVLFTHEGDDVVANALDGAAASPTVQEEALASARRQLKSDRVNSAIGAEIETLRRSGQLILQEGYQLKR